MAKRQGDEKSTVGSEVDEGNGEIQHSVVNKERIKFNVEEEFKKIYERALKLGLTGEDFSNIEVLRRIRWSGSYACMGVKYTCITLCIFSLLSVACIVTYLIGWQVSQDRLANIVFWMTGADAEQAQCVVDMPDIVHDLFRPPVDCDFCENVTKVDTVYNISAEDFEQYYGYSGVPVVIGDGTMNWTAPQYFSYEFFKEIYQDGSATLDNQVKNCQFFPYKTSFSDLGEVMRMSPERAKMEGNSEPWYIGWLVQGQKTLA